MLNSEFLNKKKQNSKTYLFEMQKFIDLVNNIEDEDLKNKIIFQMLKLEKEIILLFEEQQK